MKKICSVLLSLALLFTMVACGSAKVTMPDSIEKITISWQGGPNTTFSYTDPSKIDKLAAYFSSLDLKRTREDPMQYNGGGWIITMETGSETQTMNHYGNSFFQTPDGTWWEITYEQATALDSVLKENVPDELPERQMFDEWTNE